jgi:hypothetical protein
LKPFGDLSSNHGSRQAFCFQVSSPRPVGPRVTRCRKGGRFMGTCLFLAPVIPVTDSLRRVAGSSVEGEVILLSSSPTTFPSKGSRVGPRDEEPTPSSLMADASSVPAIIGHPMAAIRLVGVGPHPNRVILCRRVVTSPSLVMHRSVDPSPRPFRYWRYPSCRVHWRHLARS